MVTIKSFTSLEQSRKLAGILPIESADMEWVNLQSDDGEDKYEIFVNSTVNHIGMSEDIPAWSLAALLDVLPKRIKHYNVLTIDISENEFAIKYDEIAYRVNNDLPDITKDNPVDACVTMIENLHELKML